MSLKVVLSVMSAMYENKFILLTDVLKDFVLRASVLRIRDPRATLK